MTCHPVAWVTNHITHAMLWLQIHHVLLKFNVRPWGEGCSISLLDSVTSSDNKTASYFLIIYVVIVMGWTVSSPSPYVGSITRRTSGCGLTWTNGLYRCNRWRSDGRVPTPAWLCPYVKGATWRDKLAHREKVMWRCRSPRKPQTASGPAEAGAEARDRFSLEALRRNATAQHLHLGHLTSRTETQ